MNRYDYIQFNTPLESIVNPNLDLLGVTTDLDSVKYSLKQGRSRVSEHDFRLVFNLTKETATVGFSAKILGGDYHKLIGIDNIGECLNLMSSKYGLCHSINTEMALQWGSCNKLEVTKDIPIELDTEQYQNLNNLVADTHKWRLLTTRGTVYKNGFGAMRTDNSESMILYGKAQEMLQEKHRKFIDEFDLVNKFDGLTRAEVKLNSRKAIKKRFGDVTGLSQVLESEKNPPLEVFSDIFSNSEESSIVRGNFVDGQRDRERLAYAKEFDNNIGLISDDLRRRVGKNWKRDLKPIMEVLETGNPDLQTTLDLVGTLKELLTNS